MATNIETRVEGTKLIIEVDLSKEYGPTSSGKSIKVASTDGGMAVPGRDGMKMNVSVYKPAK